ncbi:hypothetical protein CPB86DRAFT_877871 [Serendipita vermifera]|nr:hypothetical protein CPB86DRAFT_877871 [Serendipita vermifera]
MLGNLDPGTGRYQPSLLDIRMKIEFLVTFKAHVTRRLLEAHLLNDPTFTQPGRRKAGLEGVEEKVETLLSMCEVEQEIEDCRIQLQNLETAEGKLKGKHVVAGELIHAPRKKRNHKICRGVVALGEKFSEEREKHLEELRRAAELMDKTDSISTILGPGNCHPSTKMYEDWFLNLREGTSLYLSANRLGRSLESMESAAAESDRISKWDKEKYLQYRIEQAELHGSHPKAVFYERFWVAVAMLSNGKTMRSNGKKITFFSAVCIGPCDECNALDLRLDHNTKHRCKVDSDPYNIVTRQYGKESTSDMIIPYFDLFRPVTIDEIYEYPGVVELISEDAMASFGYYEEEAIGHLLNDEGEPLSLLPRGLDPHLLEDTTIWRRDSTPSHVLIAAALNKLLRIYAEQNGNYIGDTASCKASELWNESVDKKVYRLVTNRKRVDYIEHRPCGYMSLWDRKVPGHRRYQSHKVCPKDESSQSADDGQIDRALQYRSGRVNKFLDLPYVLMRVYAYKALIEKDERFLRVLKWYVSV